MVRRDFAKSMSKLIAFLVAILLSAVTVFADSFVKKSSSLGTVYNKWLLAGGLIYGLTAIGWFFVMKDLKLSTLGVVYGVSCIILLTLVSVFVFNKKLSILEIVGIILGVISMIILYKFS